MATNFRQEGKMMDWTNGSGSDVKSGDVIVFANVGIGIATVDIANGETGAVAMTGVWRLPALTGLTLAQGVKVSWDGTKIVAAGSGTPCGYAFVGKVSGPTYADVKLVECSQDLDVS